MPDKTVEKLRSHLATSIDSEPAVVYLLSGTRKLIERDGSPDTSTTLKMYCHWALHLNLNAPKTTQNFLNLVDRFILNTVSPGCTPTWPTDYQDDGTFSFLDQHRLFRDFVYLDKLREELQKFLEDYGLLTHLCTDNASWFAFIAALSGVIEDGELTIESKSSKKPSSLKAVSKVVFRKGGRPLGQSPHIPFVIQWDIHLKDGRIAETAVEADSDKKTLFHGIQVLGASKFGIV